VKILAILVSNFILFETLSLNPDTWVRRGQIKALGLVQIAQLKMQKFLHQMDNT
jgi:hypothetical protein